jgi:hypothetical protein
MTEIILVPSSYHLYLGGPGFKDTRFQTNYSNYCHIMLYLPFFTSNMTVSEQTNENRTYGKYTFESKHGVAKKYQQQMLKKLPISDIRNYKQ